MAEKQRDKSAQKTILQHKIQIKDKIQDQKNVNGPKQSLNSSTNLMNKINKQDLNQDKNGPAQVHPQNLNKNKPKKPVRELTIHEKQIQKFLSIYKQNSIILIIVFIFDENQLQQQQIKIKLKLTKINKNEAQSNKQFDQSLIQDLFISKTNHIKNIQLKNNKSLITKSIYVELSTQQLRKITFQFKKFQEKHFLKSCFRCCGLFQTIINKQNFIKQDNYLNTQKYLFITNYSESISIKNLSTKKLMCHFIPELYQIIQELVKKIKSSENKSQYKQIQLICLNFNQLNKSIMSQNIQAKEILIESLKYFIKRKKNGEISYQLLTIISIFSIQIYEYKLSNQLFLETEIHQKILSFEGKDNELFETMFIQDDQKIYFCMKFYLYFQFNNGKEKVSIKNIQTKIIKKLFQNKNERMKIDVIQQIITKFVGLGLKFKQILIQQMIKNNQLSLEGFIINYGRGIYEFQQDKIKQLMIIRNYFNQKYKKNALFIDKNRLAKQFKIIFQKNDVFRFKNKSFILALQSILKIIQEKTQFSTYCLDYIIKRNKIIQKGILINQLNKNLQNKQLLIQIIKILLIKQINYNLKIIFQDTLRFFISHHLIIYQNYMREIYQLIKDQIFKIKYDQILYFQVINIAFEKLHQFISQQGLYKILRIYEQQIKINQINSKMIKIIQKNLPISIKKSQIILKNILKNYQHFKKYEKLNNLLFVQIMKLISSKKNTNRYFLQQILSQCYPNRSQLNIPKEIIIKYYEQNKQYQLQDQFNNFFINNGHLYIYYRLRFNQKQLQKRQNKLISVFKQFKTLSEQKRQLIIKNKKYYEQITELWAKIDKFHYLLTNFKEVQLIITNIQFLMHMASSYNIQIQERLNKLKNIKQKVQQFDENLVIIIKTHKFQSDQKQLINCSEQINKLQNYDYWKKFIKKRQLRSFNDMIISYNKFKELINQKLIQQFFDQNKLTYQLFIENTQQQVLEMIKISKSKKSQQIIRFINQFNAQFKNKQDQMRVFSIFLQFVRKYDTDYYNLNSSIFQDLLTRFNNKQFKVLKIYDEINTTLNKMAIKIQQNKIQSRIFLQEYIFSIMKILQSSDFKQIQIKIRNNPMINANTLRLLQNNQEQNNIQLNKQYLKIFIKLFYFMRTLNDTKNYKEKLQFFKKYYQQKHKRVKEIIIQLIQIINISKVFIDQLIELQGFIQNIPPRQMAQVILNNSYFIITFQNKNLNFSFKLLKQSKNRTDIKTRSQSYEKILQIRQSINFQLLDDHNSKQQTQSFEQISDVFKLYIVFVDQFISQIYKNLNNLINYGYDISKIINQCGKIVIKDKDLQGLQILKERIQRINTSWEQKITNIYSTSLISTHYIGRNFYKLINNFYERKPKNNILSHHSMQINQERMIRNLDYEHKVDKIIEYIKKQEKLQNQKHNRIYNRSDNYLKYLKCTDNNIISQLIKITKQIKNIFITKILFCFEETTQLQIFCFFKRSKLNSNNIYYILNPAKLNDKIKTYFIKELIAQSSNIKIEIIETQVQESLFSKISEPLKNKFKYQDKSSQESFIILQDNFSQIFSNFLIVQSKRVGLGKTYYIQKISNKQKRKLYYFPICGNIKFPQLKKRLKRLQLTDEDNLLIQLGYIQNKQKMNIFLVQLICFRGFYYEQYFILPKNTKIYIEIQNKQQQNIYQDYPVLKYLKLSGRIKQIQDFSIDILQFSNSYDQNFVLTYLQLFREQLIGTTYLQYNPQSSLNYIQTLDQKKALITTYFENRIKIKNKQSNYFQYNCYCKILLNYFRAFSLHPLFKNHEYIDQHFDITRIRLQMINTFIENSLLMIQQTVFISDFTLNQSISQNIIKEQNLNKLLIVTRKINNQQYIFECAYLKDEQIPNQLKKIFVAQNSQTFNRLDMNSVNNMAYINQLFSETALINLKSNDRVKKIQQKLRQFSPNPNIQFKNEKRYEITLDNFYKMCFIIQRSNCYLPIIIMGQSGVGKTALLQFLVKNIFQQEFIKIQVHAGIQQIQLQKQIQKIIQKSLQQLQKKKKIWVLFDQFNTTSCLSYIKQIIMDKHFLGQKMPENIVFMAACNPYRLKSKTKHKSAGLSKITRKIINQQEKQSQQLAFHVIPPPLSSLQLMWDYCQLKQEELRNYIKSIIKQIQYHKINNLIQILMFTHRQFMNQRQISSVSLRDVFRFNKLYEWFFDNMPMTPAKNRSRNKIKIDYYKMDKSQRAIILSFMFSYVFKYSTSHQRNVFVDTIQQRMGFSRGFMDSILQNQQQDYISRLIQSSQKVAYNKALRQNIFIIMVCIANKIPILIIGSPGSSKTLSVSLIQKNLQQNSNVNKDDELINKLPKIHVFYYQGSIASNSQSIIQKFQAAQRYNAYAKKNNKQKQLFPCIIFDEIGLAQASKYNPLKVLHSKLQTNSTDVCFVGISNYELDAAKMSRFLILARSPPDKNDIIETSTKLAQLYIQNLNNLSLKQKSFVSNKNNIKNYEEFFKYIGSNYFDFMQQWNKCHKKDFFGLRDFYSYLKYICQKLGEKEFIFKNIDQIYKIVSESISMNFDGSENSIQLFHTISKIPYRKSAIMNYNQMIYKNLQKHNSRSILLIGEVQCFVQFLGKNARINQRTRKMAYLHGSIFQEDHRSQIYALKTVGSILNHINYGTVLGYININQNIQTSLYDVFNKNYTQDICKVSVGIKTKLIFVHKDYNSIVFVNRELIDEINPAFLNRFEKHSLYLQQLLKEQDKIVYNNIWKWLSNLLKFIKLNPKIKLKKQNFIYNISKQSIESLIIKFIHNNSDRSNLQQNLKKQILKNSTLDLQIAMAKHMIINHQCQYNKLKSDTLNYKHSKSDLIIFTYNFKINNNGQISIIQFQNYKNQRSFKQKLKNQIKNKQTNRIDIYVSTEKQYHAIHYILFSVTQIKQIQKSNKNCRIIVCLNRFSLLARNKQSIMINHLHNIEQYFVQDLSNQSQSEQLANIIKNKLKLSDLFNKLDIDKKDESKFNNVLSIIKFSLGNQSNEQAQTFQEKMYYKGVVQLLNDPTFKNIVNENIQTILQTKNCLIQNILEFDAKISTNFKESVINYLKSQIVQLLVPIIRNIISNQQLFILPKNKIFIYYQAAQNYNQHQNFSRYFYNYTVGIKKQNQVLFEQKVLSYIQKLKQYNKKVSINEDVENDDRVFYQTSYGLQKNSIIIPENISLIPKCYTEMHKIFKNSICQSIQSKISQIKKKMQNPQNKIAVQKQWNKIRQYSAKVLSGINQNSLYLKNILDNKNTQTLFLYDTMNYYLRKFYFPAYMIKNRQFDIKKDEKDVLNIKIFGLFYHFSRLIQPLQRINEKILFLCLDRQNANNYIDLVMMLSQQTIQKIEPILIKQFNCFHQRNIKFYNNLIAIVLNQNFKWIMNNQNKNPQKYNQLQKIYQKIQQIKNQIQIKQQLSAKISIINHLFSSIKNIYQQNSNKIIQNFITYNNKNKQQLLQINIINYYSNNIMVQNKQNIQFNKKIASYFCYDLLLQSRKQLLYSDKPSLQFIITFYLKMCQKYQVFGQNIYIFLNYIFSIRKQLKIDHMEEILNQGYMLKIQQKILLAGNLNKMALILDNFFMKTLFKLSEKNKGDYLERYFKQFRQILYQQQKGASLFQLYKKSFLKLYVQYYISVLVTQKQMKILNEIDKQICKANNQHKNHIIIYMLKILVKDYKDYEQIIKLKIEIKSQWCKNYIEQMESIMVSFQTSLFVPPFLKPSQQSSYIIQDLLYKNDSNILKKYLEKSVTNSQLAYQILTFFLLKSIRKDVGQQQNKAFTQIIKDCKLLNKQQNKNYKQLLLSYINGQLIYAIKQDHFSDDDIQNQLCFLNYLNIIISLRHVQSPIKQMFFIQGTPKNFNSWSSQKHLLFTMTNPCYLRLQYLINLKKIGKTGSSYTICSKSCLYISTVGGNIGINHQGCAHVRHRGVCPLCGGDIGGVQYNKLIKSDARQFQPAQLQSLIPQFIKAKNFKFNNKQYNTKGFNINCQTIKTIKQYFKQLKQIIIFSSQIIENDTSIYIGIQQLIIFLMSMIIWLFQYKKQLINKKSLQSMLNIQQQNIQRKIKDIIYSLFNQINQKLDNKEIQSYGIMWQYGIASLIFRTVLQNKNNYGSLDNQQNKLEFLKLLRNKIGPLRDLNSQKKFVLENKNNFKNILQNKLKENNLKANKNSIFTIFTKSRTQFYQMIKQIEKPDKFINIFPQLKLFRIINYSQKLSINNIFKNYYHQLQKHQFLLSYKYNLKQSETYRNLKAIFIFISMIYQLCNHKISKNNLNKSIKQILRQFCSEHKLKQYLLALKQHINGWNYFANNKEFNIVNDCQNQNTLGSKLLNITEDASLRFFLVYENNSVQGMQLISFLQIISNTYNKLLQQLQTYLIIDIPQYKGTRITSKDEVINPCLFEKHFKFLDFSQSLMAQYLEFYSYCPLQYGQKNIIYNFTQVQKLLAKEIIGLKYLISNKKYFIYMKFIGQETEFIDKLKYSQFQLSLGERRTNIQNLFINAAKDRRQTFFKCVRHLQSLLQQIIIYCKSLKMDDFIKLSIGKFINNYKIDLNKPNDMMSQKIQRKDYLNQEYYFIDQQSIQELSMENIVDLYDLVEYYAYSNVIGQIDNRFKKSMTPKLKTQLEEVINKMKLPQANGQQRLPRFQQYREALYRFVGKTLMTENSIQTKSIFEFLFYIESFWSKQSRNILEQFQYHKDLSIFKEIKLANIGDVLKLVPHSTKQNQNHKKFINMYKFNQEE